MNPPNSGEEISVFMWVYPLSNNGIIISEQGAYPPDSSWFDSQIELVSGDLYFRAWPSGGIMASSTIPIGDWSYVGFALTFLLSFYTVFLWIKQILVHRRMHQGNVH